MVLNTLWPPPGIGEVDDSDVFEEPTQAILPSLTSDKQSGFDLEEKLDDKNEV